MKTVYVVRFRPTGTDPVLGLTQIFGVDEQTARSLVMSTPVAVKRNATPEDALRVKAALESIGAEVAIKEDAQTSEPALSLDMSAMRRPRSPQPSAAGPSSHDVGGRYEPPPEPPPPKRGTPGWIPWAVIAFVVIGLAWGAQVLVSRYFAAREAEEAVAGEAAAEAQRIDRLAEAAIASGDCSEARTWIREESSRLAGMSPDDGRALVDAIYGGGAVQVQACGLNATGGNIGNRLVAFVVPGMAHDDFRPAVGIHGHVLEGRRYVIVELE